MTSTHSIIVSAAVIRDSSGRILLTRRPDHTHMGGLWEFPGGKIENGESPAGALRRELHEELGIEAAIDRPLTFAVHEEPELRVLLLFFAVRVLEGDPTGREGQELCWVRPSELSEYRLPPADTELVARLIDGAFS
jgi:8-oxo-dGTP diphosphatase